MHASATGNKSHASFPMNARSRCQPDNGPEHVEGLRTGTAQPRFNLARLVSQTRVSATAGVGQAKPRTNRSEVVCETSSHREHLLVSIETQVSVLSSRHERKFRQRGVAGITSPIRHPFDGATATRAP